MDGGPVLHAQDGHGAIFVDLELVGLQVLEKSAVERTFHRVDGQGRVTLRARLCTHLTLQGGTVLKKV